MANVRLKTALVLTMQGHILQDIGMKLNNLNRTGTVCRLPCLPAVLRSTPPDPNLIPADPKLSKD